MKIAMGGGPMKYKVTIGIMAVIIVFLTVLILLSSDHEAVLEFSLENDVLDVSEKSELPNDECTHNDVMLYNAENAIDEPLHCEMHTLHDAERLDPDLLHSINEQFRLSRVHGFTYFFFFDNGERSLVVFAEAVQNADDPDLAFRDTKVIAEINGELRYVWLNVFEAWPHVITRINHQTLDINQPFTTPALLVTVWHVASFTEVLVLTYEDDNLRVQRLIPQSR